MSHRADTLLMYGATDTGKTSQLGEIAKWYFAKTGKISRLISADSGWDPIEHLVVSPQYAMGTPGPLGDPICCEAWAIQGLANPWVILVELSEGAWPEAISTPTGSRLRMKKAIWKDGFPLAMDGVHQIGQYLIEGLATIATVGMQDHINTARGLAQEIVKPFQSAVGEVDATGKESQRTLTLASASMSHYGQVQRWLLDDLVPRFGKLSVDRIVWTSHEGRGTDDINVNSAVLGPLVIGKAVADKTTQKFGHSFHMTVDTQSKQDLKAGKTWVERDFRAWFVSHPDETLKTMKWPAKVSLPISRAQELLKKFPGGFIPLNEKGMTQFLEFLEKAFPPEVPNA